MTGIKINNIHTFNDLGLTMFKYISAKPTKNESQLSIMGANGIIDLSSIFGDPTYINYTQLYQFEKEIDIYEFESFRSHILNLFHGQNVEVIQDNDTDYKRIGVANVDCYFEGIYAKINISCNFQPFKLKTSLTTETIVTTTSTTETVVNAQMPSTPTFYTDDSNMAVQVNGDTLYSLLTEGHTINEIYFKQGENTVKIQGNGTVIVKWQEGVI